MQVRCAGPGGKGLLDFYCRLLFLSISRQNSCDGTGTKLPEVDMYFNLFVNFNMTFTDMHVSLISESMIDIEVSVLTDYS